MSKFIVLTAALLAAGADAIAKAIVENPSQAAADILALESERNQAVDIAEKSLEALDKQPVIKAENIPSFTLGEENYGFNFKSMIHNGKRISVEEVQADEAL